MILISSASKIPYICTKEYKIGKTEIIGELPEVDCQTVNLESDCVVSSFRLVPDSQQGHSLS